MVCFFRIQCPQPRLYCRDAAPEPAFAESLAAFQRAEDKAGVALARLRLGLAAWERGSLDLAEERLGAALAQFRALGATWGVATTLASLGDVARACTCRPLREEHMTSQHPTIPHPRRDEGATDPLIDWLLAGDPAIAWQTQRDLLAAPAPVWQSLRERTLTEGWGGRLIALQDADGGWGGGVYSPKWTSATYTLLTLCDLGVPPTGPATARGARHVLAGLFGEQAEPAFGTRLAACDRCIVGMALRIACTFVGDDPRIEPLVVNLLAEQMPDGGWNCRRHRRPSPTHSSFHTTLNVLEGIRAYLESPAAAYRQELVQAEAGALELLLQHRLYRSDKTGAVIREEWTHPVYPYRWHYDVLRGLAYVARAAAPRDGRLAEAVGLLEQRRQADGSWLRGKAYSGRVFFTMEPAGPSRWNTLRALRVLHWWQSEQVQGAARLSAGVRPQPR